ncbi:MAG: DNA primase regulatory subunit PriL [Archaeoglobaceae archaeon]
MKFLPVFRLLSVYPFLKLAVPLFGSIEIEKEVSKLPEIAENAKNIVEDSLKGKRCEKKSLAETAGFPCIKCDLGCFKCIEIGKFQNCNLCLKCFANCKISYRLEDEKEIVQNAKIAVLTHFLARMLVSRLEDWARMRFAVQQANGFKKAFEKESEEVLRILAFDLGIKLKGWNTHVSGYLKAAARIRSDEWRLVNRKIVRGFVKTSKVEVIRIMEEMLRIRLFERTSGFAKILEPKLKELQTIAVKERKVDFEIGEVDMKCLPPCMLEILSELHRGMNVPHTARFALTSFLLNIGMDVEDIIRLFKAAPDFDEEKSRYQVEHIAGMKGKGAEYVSPSCDTMKSYHNCVANCNVKHPLIFYRNCKSKKRKI